MAVEAFQQLGHGDVRSPVVTLIDLVEQPGEELLGLALGVRRSADLAGPRLGWRGVVTISCQECPRGPLRLRMWPRTAGHAGNSLWALRDSNPRPPPCKSAPSTAACCIEERSSCSGAVSSFGHVVLRTQMRPVD